MKKAILLFCFLWIDFIFGSTPKELDIGSNPTPPSQDNTLVDGLDLSSIIEKEIGKAPPTLSNTSTTISDPISLLNPNGALLTVWARREGDWLWGYTLYDSIPFGDARIWRIITHSNGKVSFKNELTGNCMTAYKNGVIHLRCDNENATQRWDLIFFRNQAVQIKNEAYGNCLQSPKNLFLLQYLSY